jgi:hypothetical protein
MILFPRSYKPVLVVQAGAPAMFQSEPGQRDKVRTDPANIWGCQIMNALLRNYVNCKWIHTTSTFVNINPVTGTKIGDVSEAEQDSVAGAVSAARAAMNGEWGRRSDADRAGLLRKVADRITRSTNERARAGSPTQQSVIS